MEEDRIFDSDQECGGWEWGLKSASTLITCSPAITGRYVQIQLVYYSAQLVLYEVDIYGY